MIVGGNAEFDFVGLPVGDRHSLQGGQRFIGGVLDLRRQTHERLIKVEVQLQTMKDELDKTAIMVKDMHTLLTKAQGARWVVFGLIATGGAVAGWAAALKHLSVIK